MTTTAVPTPTPSSATGLVRGARLRDRSLGLSGVAFAALLLPVVLVPHASLDYEPTHPPRDGSVITSFFEKHYALEQYQALMHSLAAVALLVFFSALAGHVRGVNGPGSLVARLTSGAGTAMAAIMILTMGLVAGSISLTGGVDGITEGWLYAIGWWEHFKCLYLLPVALIPACRVLRRARVLPAVLAWPGQVVGLLGGVAMVGVLDASTEFLMFPVFILLLLWMLATGVVALTRGLAVPAATD